MSTLSSNMYLQIVLFLLVCAYIDLIHGATTVKASAPVQPVDEGAILSLHCEVFNLEPNQQVILYRTRNGQTSTLSLGEGVSHDVDERVFLAIRQQLDGSTVFFLSIMSVTRHEGGQYFCKVFNVADHAPSPVSSITIDVSYFPSSLDPVCSPKEPPIANIGDIMTMNCSSERASPSVSITWRRSDKTQALHATTYDSADGRIQSMLKFRVKSQDSKVIFTCEISSPAFPGRKQACHIGPVVVIGAHHDNSPNVDSEQEIGLLDIITETPRYPLNKHDENNVLFTGCEEYCSLSGNSLLYWVISTCVAGIMAFVFLILGVSLFIKFNRLSEEGNNTQYISSRQPADKIYDELESRRIQHSMYMSLEKARQVELQSVYPTCES